MGGTHSNTYNFYGETNLAGQVGSVPPFEEPHRYPTLLTSLRRPLEESSFGLGIEQDVASMKQEIFSYKGHDPEWRFEDISFPAAVESISLQNARKWSKVTWKRCHEISPDEDHPAILINDGVAQGDVVQGHIENCWWLSAVTAICRNRNLMRKVIGSDFSMTYNYVGAFHFRFWQHNKWVDVIVDDKLPVDADTGKLIFGKTETKNEFWLSLLEKAYAKLHGNYINLGGGYPKHALEDLTGGIVIEQQLGENIPTDFYRTLLKAFQHGTFMCCSIFEDTKTDISNMGLVPGHAYTITGVTKAWLQGHRVPLVQVRNPWGISSEGIWKGAWSEGSSEWKKLSSAEQKRLQNTKDYDDLSSGAWWMSFADFKKYYDRVTLCAGGNDIGDKWKHNSIEGEWVKGVNAGGCINDPESFAKNSQYHFEVRAPDKHSKEYDDPSNHGKCAVAMVLSQEYRRTDVNEAVETHPIGLSLYKVDSRPENPLSAEFFRSTPPLITSGAHRNERGVHLAAFLEPGHYVGVPSTFEKGKVGKFNWRAIGETGLKIGRILLDHGKKKKA